MDKQKISISDIEHLAELSGLEFSDVDKQVMLNEVVGILDMFDACAEADDYVVTDNKVMSLSDLRDDEVSPSLSKEDVFKNTPRVDRGYVVVPRVVE